MRRGLISKSLTKLVKDVGDGASTNGAAAFTDGELGSLFHSDRVDQLDGEGDVVTRHDHVGPGRKSDGAGDVGGTEEELRTIAVEEFLKKHNINMKRKEVNDLVDDIQDAVVEE